MNARDNIALLVAIVLLIAACTSTATEEEQVYQAFLLIQENIVDNEEANRAIVQENLQLRSELNNLQEQAKQLAQLIEKENHRTQFVQETGTEIPSPQDRISDQQIRISKNRVIIDVQNVNWAGVLDTNSMDPLLDAGTTVLMVKPNTPEDIKVGDIIVFTRKDQMYPIVHRVHDITEEGLYRTRGDNSPVDDPFAVSFTEVNAVVVGILY